jgi:transcriptional regulator with XRE-family HTH domain
MATRERPADRGSRRGVELLRLLGSEARAARLDRDLSLRAVGAALGCSRSKVWRVERAEYPSVSVAFLARLFAVVGLDLAARGYAGGSPVRTEGQNRLLERLHHEVHPSLRWLTEVALPLLGDQRRWDSLIVGSGWRQGVEAETGPRDAQALAGRIELKRRDGAVDGVILLLPATRRVREFLAAAQPILAPHFPVPGEVALSALRAGRNPGGSAIIVLRYPDRTWPLLPD